MAFVKLDAGILRSTIWYRRPALEVFLTALLMAEPWELEADTPTLKVDSLDHDDFIVPKGWYGFVRASGPGIVHQSGIEDQAAGVGALRELSQPESESRSQEHEGRRMVRVNGGYIVLNFMRYRDYDHNAADRMRKLRARRKTESVTANGNGVRANVTHSREQKAESRKAEAPKASIPSPAATDAEIVYALYPRKQGKAVALKAITGALKRNSLTTLSEATAAFKLATDGWPADRRQFIPHPATWFNAGSYDDDRSTWVYVPKDTTVSWQRRATTDEEHAGGF